VVDSTSHIEEAYEAMGDGSMDACLGHVCPASCCREKTRVVGRGESLLYRTLLWDEAEAAYQQSLSPSVDKAGGVIYGVPSFGGRVPGRQVVDSHIYLVNGCQNGDGSCRLAERKPLVCRIFPFSLDPQNPLLSVCPSVVRACADPKIVERIMKVRSVLGLASTNQYWRSNVHEEAAMIRELLEAGAYLGGRIDR